MHSLDLDLDTQMSNLEIEWREGYEASIEARADYQQLAADPKANADLLDAARERLDPRRGAQSADHDEDREARGRDAGSRLIPIVRAAGSYPTRAPPTPVLASSAYSIRDWAPEEGNR